MIEMVMSGGQIGADIAGLRAAKACGIETGGFMPRGYRTLLGPLDPELVDEFNLREIPERNYRARTEKNVQTTDGTIRLAYDFTSPGERATLNAIRRFKRPVFDVRLVPDGDGWVIPERGWWTAHALAWLEEKQIGWLNVAGNGDPAIEAPVQAFLTTVFRGHLRAAQS